MHQSPIQAAVQDALDAYNLAHYGGASQEAVEAAGRELTAAIRASQTPEEKARDLRAQADRLNTEAEKLWSEAGDYYGWAYHRRNQGEAQLADDFFRMVRARDQLAAEKAQEALRLNLDAASIEGRLNRAGMLAEVVRHDALGRCEDQS